MTNKLGLAVLLMLAAPIGVATASQLQLQQQQLHRSFILCSVILLLNLLSKIVCIKFFEVTNSTFCMNESMNG